jgi:hypothetical protein
MSKEIVPKWEISQVIQIGKEAVLLTEGKKKEIEPRVSAGLLDGLPADIAQLESLFTGRPAKTIEVKGMTGSEKDVARKGGEWVSAIREAVKRRAKGTGLPKAVGVGEAVHGDQSTSVASAVEAVLKAAQEYPDEIRACGVIESDIQKGQAILDSLVGARNTQDTGMKGKKNLTTQKNTIQIRIEKAIEEISTGGYIQFMDTDKVLAKRFQDLIPSSGKPPKDPPEPPKA